MTDQTVSDIAMPAEAPTLGMPRHHMAIFAGLLVFLLVAPFFLYPVFLMKVLCFALFACAFNLLLGYGGLLSFGHAAFFGSASYVSAHAAKVWGLTPELAILSGTVVAAVLGLVIGALAIRRQGIYFAMVTLAFAQMVFFFCVQAAFTGGEDGIQAVPRGRLFGMFDIASDRYFYFFVLAIVFVGLLDHLPDHPFALRPRPQGDPRERTALGLARLSRQPLQAGGVRHVGRAGGARRGHQGAGVPARVADRRLLDHVRRGGADGAARRHGHRLRPDRRRGDRRLPAELLRRLRAWVTVIEGVVFVFGVLLFREGIVGVIARWTRRSL